jgi:hypothetical protein
LAIRSTIRNVAPVERLPGHSPQHQGTLGTLSVASLQCSEDGGHAAAWWRVWCPYRPGEAPGGRVVSLGSPRSAPRRPPTAQRVEAEQIGRAPWCTVIVCATCRNRISSSRPRPWVRVHRSGCPAVGRGPRGPRRSGRRCAGTGNSHGYRASFLLTEETRNPLSPTCSTRPRSCREGVTPGDMACRGSPGWSLSSATSTRSPWWGRNVEVDGALVGRRLPPSFSPGLRCEYGY